MGYGYSVAEGAKTVMAEPYAELTPYGEYDSETVAREDYEAAWWGFKNDIWAVMPKSWAPEYGGNVWRRGHPAGLVIASNGLFEMLLEEDQGGYGYAMLSIVPREVYSNNSGWDNYSYRMLNLALANLDKHADAVFAPLSKIWDLRVPGGYVSSPYTPKKETQKGGDEK
jgi:hypothetical protein